MNFSPRPHEGALWQYGTDDEFWEMYISGALTMVTEHEGSSKA